MKKYNILISVDGEGCSGIRKWKDVVDNFYTDHPTEKLRKAMAGDLNAVIKGLAESNCVKNIYVLDWHGTGKNLRRSDINNQRINLILKSWNIQNLEKFCKSSDYAIVLGMHGKFGSRDGIPPLTNEEFLKNKRTGLSHFNMFGIKNAFFNKKSINESVSSMILFKELKVPLIFVSGSKAAIDELKRFAKEITTSITGRTLSLSKLGREKITQSVKSAIKKATKGKGFVGLNDNRLSYRSFSLEFKKPNNKLVKKELSGFLKLDSKGKLKVLGRNIFFPGKGNRPYFNDYKLIQEI